MRPYCRGLQKTCELLRAAMYEALLAKRKAVLEYFTKRLQQGGSLELNQLRAQVAELGLADPQRWASCGLPSDSWLRMMVQSQIQEMTPFQERALAGVDAGAHATISLDFTFAAAK